MNHPVLVGITQGFGRIAGDPKRFVDGQLPFPGEPATKRLSFDKRHCEPEPLGGIAGVQNGQDVWMLKSGGDSNFAKKALRAECGGELRAQNLEGNRSVVAKIMREIHCGHTTAPELALEDVAVAESIG